MSKIIVRSLFDYDWKKASREAALTCKDPSLTKQSFLEESDINTIVKRFNLTGQLPDNVREPRYGDYEGVFDFHTAMNAVRQAQEGFDILPAHIRARFHNDPQELLEFMADDNNRPEAEKMGLTAPRKPQDGPAATGGTPSPSPAPAAPAAPEPQKQ